MLSLLLTILKTTFSSLKSYRHLALENLALRQQLAMLKQSGTRPRVSFVDRVFWMLFSKTVDRWRAMLHVLHPDTIVRWHRNGFRRYWTFKSRRRRPGRPSIDAKYASSSDKCSRRTSAGALLEFTGNYSSLALRFLKRQSRTL